MSYANKGDMKKLSYILTAVILCAAMCAQAHAARRFPQTQGYVSDFAGVLSQDTKRQIGSLLDQVEEKTTAEIAVVTVKTTQPETIEQYAVELFKEWGIGKKGKDNGILVLLAAEDRKVRIEVGYGLEGTVTDLQSKMIIEDFMIPAFRKGSYDLGISAGVVMLVKLVRDHYGVVIDLSKEEEALPKKEEEGSPVAGLLVFLFFMIIFGRWGPLFFLMSGGSRGWSSGGGGSFGGSFGGFGGGMSGGGGASGSW